MSNQRHPAEILSPMTGIFAALRAVLQLGGSSTRSSDRVLFPALLLVVLTCVVLPASGETLTPWFHLSSVSRPGNLHSGQAKNTVQHLTVSATKGEVFLGNGQELEELNKGQRTTFAHIDVPYNIKAAQLQEQLQKNVFPANELTVTGGPGDEKGSSSYVITFPGQSVQPIVAGSGAEPLSCEGAIEPATCTGEATVTKLSDGQPDGELSVIAVNVGDAAVDGKTTPVTVSDELPAGLTAVSVEGTTRNNGHSPADGPVDCEMESARTVECTFAGSLPAFNQIEVAVAVAVEPGARSSSQTGEDNQVGVSGGGAPAANTSAPVTISDAPTPFGVESYELTPEEVGGTLDAQAGSHPFQLTTTLNLNEGLAFSPEAGREVPVPAALAKDLTFKLPAGLIGNPTAYPHCTLAQFATFVNGANECASNTVLGVALVTFHEGFSGSNALFTATDPIFNLEPSVGEPARFGFEPAGVPVFLDTSIRTGEDYGVTVHVENIPQAIGFLTNSVTFWGVPGDQRHDQQRGITCLEAANSEAVGETPAAPCVPLGDTQPPPFLALPTSCTGEPLHTEVLADSWVEPGKAFSPEPDPSAAMGAMDGCGLLPFGSQIKVSPDVQEGSTPSGLKVDVHVPQEEALNPGGLAPADVKNITVTLPNGLQLNPSAADGLQACSQEQVGLSNDNEVSCPNASKIAKVTIRTPLLPNPLTGFVYLASPQNFSPLTGAPRENPFSSLVAMYLVARDPVSGVLVKLPGSVSLNQGTGQITSTFANNPQLPFEDAEIEFFGGERAPLATPARCQGYETGASFEPWTNTPGDEEDLQSKSVFDITSGPNGSSCPGAALPFAPSLASGTTNINAGSFTPLSTTLSREDGQQPIQSVTLHYPAGVSGLLSGVKLCPEAQANAGTCPPESEIGETIVSVGLGGDPFTVTGGRVYITEKYEGAPFGLSIVNPAKAGPFDLQEGRPVVVRAKVEVDPHTAALTITTDPSGSPHAIPTIIEGFPLQIKHVNVNITRPGFTFNPTNCTPTAITGAINSSEGASSPVQVPFQVTNCASLKFAPKFAVSTSGKTSRSKGASLTAKVTYPQGSVGTYANIARVKVDLPKQLPSRLTTLQKACTAAQFEANPADCPAASLIGHAKAITPLIPVPLEGPAIFVSHGGEAFPSLIVVLQGYGVTIDLVGTTFISHAGITSSTFKTVPDAPVGSFELNLPEGKYSALAANGNLCKSKLAMPTEFLAQNGMKINESTKIKVNGCPPARKKAKKAKKNHKHKQGKGDKRSKK